MRALRGANLVVPSGDFVALMGPSGCGKSTLLNLVAGLDVADEGTITVAGELVTGRTEDELSQLRRRHIGIVFQFFNLLEGMTVLENVALPAVIAGRKRKMAESRARDLLDLLGIGDKAGTVPGMLSGGQRQRLAIARGAGQRADAVAGRRADRRLGLRRRSGGHRTAQPPAHRRADHHPRHPRRRRRVGRRADRTHARRKDRGGRGVGDPRGRRVLRARSRDRARRGAGGGGPSVRHRRPLRREAPSGSFRLLQVLLFGLTVACVVIGWRIAVPHGTAPASSVAFALTLAWALVGIVDTRARERGGSKASPFHLLAASDALVAAVALTAGRKAEMVHAI